MKKLKLGMLLCFAVFLLGGCQIYSVVKDATDREEGRVVMKAAGYSARIWADMLSAGK